VADRHNFTQKEHIEKEIIMTDIDANPHRDTRTNKHGDMET